MIRIKSQEYLRDLYRFLRKQENQGVFVINFFNAAGCTYFELPKLKSHRTTQYLENERHYAKDRSVLLIKDKFPDVIDIDNLRAYIEQELNDEKIRDCMSYFAISVSLPENKSFLAHALANQFQLFVDAAEEDIKSEIPNEYVKLANGQKDSLDVRRSALYTGDDFWVEKQSEHQVSCYKRFMHTWTIHNAGSVYWQGRKLVLKNENKNNPRPEDKEILIPDVAPNEYKKIATNFEARSIEGRFVCEWEMQDSNGQACFSMNAAFDVTVDVSFDIDTED